LGKTAIFLRTRASQHKGTDKVEATCMVIIEFGNRKSGITLEVTPIFAKFFANTFFNLYR